MRVNIEEKSYDGKRKILKNIKDSCHEDVNPFFNTYHHKTASFDLIYAKNVLM